MILARLIDGEVIDLPGWESCIQMYQLSPMHLDGDLIFGDRSSNWRCPMDVGTFVRMCEKHAEIERGEEVRVLSE